MFLDESGNHDLERINAQYPVFVLGGVIADRTYARAVIEPRVRQFKQELFGRDDIVLHTAEIARKKNAFECLKDPNLNDRFLRELTGMMQELEYQVVACVINMDRHVAKYGPRVHDPYHFSLGVLVERFVLEIGSVLNGGVIWAEKRRPDLDHALEQNWQLLRLRGTDYVSAQDIDERIVDLSLKDKKLNIAGMQLADLVVSPIGRTIIGKRTHADWRVVESKFRRVAGTYEGCGLVVLPR
jgi:hypothetical protein